MSHAVKYYVEHISDVDGNQKTYRIELLEDGFGGSATEKKALGEIFTFEFERRDREELFKGIVQNGRLELHLAIQDSTDLTILNNIVAGDEDQYQLRLKEDGSTKWTGFVIPDLIEYSEGDYPFRGTITAKDISILQGTDYPTNTDISYKLLIEGLADILNNNGLNIGLHSYNDWSEVQLDNTDDYLNQVYFDEYHLQNFASYSEGTFEPITYQQAIKELIPPGWVVRQWDNVWNLLSIDSIALNSGTIRRFEYDSTGTKTGSTSSVDLTDDISRVSKFVMPSSIRKPWRAAKEIDLEYNHKSAIQNILFESEYTITGAGGTIPVETLELGDTTERTLVFSGEVEVTTDTNPGSSRTGNAHLYISVDGYQLDIGDGTWDTAHGEQDVLVEGDDNTLTATFQINSENIPTVTGGNNELSVELRYADVSGEVVQEVRWFGLSLSVNNAQNVDNGSSNNFRLRQSGNYTGKLNAGTIIFGQGPFADSNSALRYFNTANSEYDILSRHRHVGGDLYSYPEFLLKNTMNMKRSTQNSIRATLRALMNPINVFGYDGNDYFFLGGTLTGKESIWNGELVSLNWTTGTDTFESFFKIGQSDSGTVVPPSSGTSEGGDFDDRYFRQSNLFSEIATADQNTALSNLGLTATKDELNIMDGATLSTAELNLLDGLTATTAELNQLDGNTFTSGITGTTADFSGALDADTLRTDTGKFLSPTSYQFRNAGDTGFRDVQMGGLTATTGVFSGLLTAQNGLNVTNGDVGVGRSSPAFTSGNGIHLADNYYIGFGDGDNGRPDFQIGFDPTDNYLSLRAGNGSDTDDIIIEPSGDVLSGTFDNATWAGSGYRGTNAGDWVVENLRVRHALEVYEFVAKQISSVGGKEILSIANGRIESIDTGANTIDVQDVRGQSATSFKAGDLWIVQVTDINNDLESGGTGSIVRSVRGSVTSVSGETLTVSVSSGSLSDLEENDLIVAYGSSDSARNAIMYRNVDRSDDNLIMRVQTGVTSFGALTDPDNTRVAFGDLYGSAGTAYADYSSETFGFFAGDNASDKITVDATNGVRFLDGSNNIMAQFNASKLTVGDGFEYDAPSNTLSVAAFTVNSDYLTDGNTYIGNNLGSTVPDANAEDQILLGNFQNGSLPILRIIGDGGGSQNKVEFVGRSNTSRIMTMRQGGNDVAWIDGNAAKFFGAFVDGSGIWAGGGATSNPATKSDSNFWAKFDTGEFFYDAMIATVWARDTIAGFGAGSQADDLDDDEWTASRASSTPGDNVIETKIRARYRHRFGFNNMLLNYLIRVESSGDGTGTGAVYLTVRNMAGSSVASGTIDVGPTGTTEDTLTIDISSLTPGQYYTVEVDLEAQVGNVNSGTVTITSHLREDAIIYATT